MAIQKQFTPNQIRWLAIAIWVILLCTFNNYFVNNVVSSIEIKQSVSIQEEDNVNIGIYNVSNNDGCIYCRSSHFSHDYSYNFCRKEYFMASSKDIGLLKATELMNDSDYIKQCPINKYDSLYNYVSSMIESKSSIFTQISMIENKEIIIYNKTDNIPPKWDELSIELQNQYTFNNSITLENKYLNNFQNNNKNYKLQWTEKYINDNVKNIKNKSWDKLYALYGAGTAKQFYELLTSKKYANKIINSNSIVIGSQFPWLEILLLAAGASHVSTAEYGVIDTQHPQMTWIHPSKFNETFIDLYDVIIQYSSLEHAGLGRYGDPIDPVGDVKMMNQLSCLAKPNGLMFYASPIGNDGIAWNAHRYYGQKRLRLMFMQWRVIDVYEPIEFVGFVWSKQPWIVLQNKRGCFGW